jgi:hypothetical protein
LLLSIALCALLVVPLPRAAAEKGYYTVAEIDGVWWFVDPQGKKFYSLGVSDIGAGPAREAYDPNRPAYAAFLHYKSNRAWAADTQRRLVDWKFNTIGGWADAELTAGPLPHAVVLHLGSQLGFPWIDAFDDRFETDVETLARDQVAPRSRDRNLLGWYSDNEQSWYPDSLFSYHLAQSPESATRKKLLAILRDQYDNDFVALQGDFEAIGAASFEELERGGELKLRASGNGRRGVVSFVAALAQRYYQVVHDAIRRNDPNHLILGDRYAWHCPDVVAKAAVPFVDVISTNFDWPEATDGFLPDGYLCNLHRVTGKPVLVSEYYVAASENRSGNKNTGGIFLTVATLKERAAAFENRLRILATQPYVVGAHWFRFADEPPHGRPRDGEDYNFGLVDIDNRPYDVLIGAMTRLHSRVPHMHESSAASIAVPDSIAIPPARGEARTLHTRLVHAQSLTPVDDSLQLYDLAAAWSRDELHIAVLACHVSEREVFSPSLSAKEHVLEFTVASPGLDRPVRIRFGGGADAMSDNPHVNCWLTAKGLRYTLVVSVPAVVLNRRGFQADDSVPLTLTLNDLLDKQAIACERTLVLASADADALAGGLDTSQVNRREVVAE